LTGVIRKVGGIQLTGPAPTQHSNDPYILLVTPTALAHR
jgi:hypothetical protein